MIPFQIPRSYSLHIANKLNFGLYKAKNDQIGSFKKQISESTTTISDPNDNVPFIVDGYEFMSYKSKKWIKIFEHNASFGFFTPNNVLLNNNPHLYSILKYIPKINRPNKLYSFLLRYPGHEGENIFNQTQSPFATYSSKSEMGLEIDPSSTWQGELFSGLMISAINQATYMQCCIIAYWHFAIGAYQSYRSPDKFPGPDSAFDANRVILWMEIKSFVDAFDFIVCTYNPNVYFRISFSFINVFILI